MKICKKGGGEKYIQKTNLKRSKFPKGMKFGGHSECFILNED